MPEVKGWSSVQTQWPVPKFLPWVTGRFYGYPFGLATGTTAAASTVMRLIPIYVPNLGGVTVTSIGVEVTAGGTGSLARFGIYGPQANGLPGDLIVDGGTAATTGTGFVSVSVSTLLRQGWWYAAVAHATTSSLPTVRASSATIMTGPLGASSPADTTAYQRYSVYNVAAYTQAAANSGLPGGFPIWSQVLADFGVGDRVLVGV